MIKFRCKNNCSAEYTMDGKDFFGYDTLEHWCSICGHTDIYKIGIDVIVINNEEDKNEFSN